MLAALFFLRLLPKDVRKVVNFLRVEHAKAVTQREQEYEELAAADKESVRLGHEAERERAAGLKEERKSGWRFFRSRMKRKWRWEDLEYTRIAREETEGAEGVVEADKEAARQAAKLDRLIRRTGAKTAAQIVAGTGLEHRRVLAAIEKAGSEIVTLPHPQEPHFVLKAHVEAFEPGMAPASGSGE